MDERLDDRSNLDRLRVLQDSLESTEQELVIRDALLAAVVENAHDAIIARDLKGRIIVWNEAAERLYGYSAEEMIGGSIFKIIPEEKIAEHSTWIAAAKSGQGTGPLRTERLTRDGKRISIVISVSPVIARTGEVVGISAIEHEDI